MQLHEGNEAEHLGLFWQKPGKHPRQPQRVVGQVAPHRGLRPSAQVALVEHQVEDGRHRLEPRHQLRA